jgi:murein DD-endopeptidase MepM/ murein hydrolase activator NlpD
MKYFESYERISSPYGERIHPIKKEKIFHAGIDVVKDHKGEVYATVPGEVVFAEFAQQGTGLGGYGNTVCVRDKNGALHIYAHLDSIRARFGQQVNKDALLGFQGNTGQSAGSHLHYEVRLKSSPSFGWKSHTDPIAYLDKYYAEVEAPKNWKEVGLEFLQKEYGISKDWKATDAVDIGTLGIILKRGK